MGQLKNMEEYQSAFCEYMKIIGIVYKETGVNLSDAKISRIDVTKDVLTPSDAYTSEIIRILKIKKLPYGFRNKTFLDYLDQGWNYEKSLLANNSSKGISLTVYNKRQNLIDFGHSDVSFLDEKGLIRFELTLNWKYLKKAYDINRDDVVGAIEIVLGDADNLVRQHIIEPLNFGQYLSIDLLEKIIERKIRGTKRKEKMLRCVDECIRCLQLHEQLEVERIGGRKKYKKILKYFKDLDVSPIPLQSQHPFIPSVEELVMGKLVTPHNLNFAKKHSRGKEIWKYE